MVESRAARIWKRTRVGATLAFVVAGLVWASASEHGAVLVLVLGSLLAAWGLFEVHGTGVLGARLSALGVLPAVLATALVLGPRLHDPPASALAASGLTALGTAAVALAAVPGYRKRTLGAPALLWGPFALAAWLVLPMAWLAVVRAQGGTGALAVLIVLAKVGDIAGYYVGNALGRSHPFPRLSPGKTTAGCVGSLLAALVAGSVCQGAGLLPPARLGPLSGALAGALVNVAAQGGDLLESLFKRRAGVKDSGTTFGPSGGLLDLVDSVLLAVPAALLAGALLFDQGGG